MHSELPRGSLSKLATSQPKLGRWPSGKAFDCRSKDPHFDSGLALRFTDANLAFFTSISPVPPLHPPPNCRLPAARATKSDTEQDFKLLLEQLLADLLVVACEPEWPAAAVLLLRFLTTLSGSKGLQHAGERGGQAGGAKQEGATHGLCRCCPPTQCRSQWMLRALRWRPQLSAAASGCYVRCAGQARLQNPTAPLTLACTCHAPCRYLRAPVVCGLPGPGVRTAAPVPGGSAGRR